MQGFAPHPTSFIGIKEAKELHFWLKYIVNIISIVLLLALFATFCGGKKLNKKLISDKLKKFYYIHK
ncbi:hypothetical protein BP951000_0688 [Brachyspira pilosicoli 95/1000]|uniref:Uncharacterized protein n=1 Tax=Brachyspira pilosicoli (strain ATCC BAA-1826 / 95/1000) TaxID=759914 RepID=D8IC14_BRAP9|nr:hypothetical protein BP951000_0688 [Brachyspira pilosicoli 95/1000]